MTSKLCTGVHSTEIDINNLKLLPAPKSLGRFHKPIHPVEIIKAVQGNIEKFDHEVVNTKIAINPKQTKMFATMDLEPLDDDPTRAWSVGIISSIDRSAAMKLAAGSRIFVCDNLMATGDIFEARRKHTSGFDIEKEVEGMVIKVLDNCKEQDKALEVQKSLELNEQMAYRIIGEALIKKFMSAVMIRAVLIMWLKKEYEDIESRSVLGLHNAFTRQIQKMTPAKQLPTAIRIGKFFEGVTRIVKSED